MAPTCTAAAGAAAATRMQPTARARRRRPPSRAWTRVAARTSHEAATIARSSRAASPRRKSSRGALLRRFQHYHHTPNALRATGAHLRLHRQRAGGWRHDGGLAGMCLAPSCCSSAAAVHKPTSAWRGRSFALRGPRNGHASATLAGNPFAQQSDALLDAVPASAAAAPLLPGGRPAAFPRRAERLLRSARTSSAVPRAHAPDLLPAAAAALHPGVPAAAAAAAAVPRRLPAAAVPQRAARGTATTTGATTAAAGRARRAGAAAAGVVAAARAAAAAARLLRPPLWLLFP